VKDGFFAINGSPVLVTAGWMSIAAALAHVACIVGGTPWYLFMGAPPQLVLAAEQGDGRLAIMTACIAIIIFGWAAYAFSAAGLTKRLPFTRLALIAICFVLLGRGMSYFLFPLWSGWRPDLPQTFLIWSSAICVVMGATFALGTWQVWHSIDPRAKLD
jgi:hypothetical protein